jgi:hypothetical protein
VLTKKQIRSTFAKIAEDELGVREEGGPNKGPRIRQYQSATWLEPESWPWCAAFVCWVIQQGLKLPDVRRSLGIVAEDDAMRWRPKTAGAYDFANWAKKRSLAVLSENNDCYRGDIVIFDFSHIGLVVQDAPATSEFIQTIEGNTNGLGSRDGDGVFLKKRRRELVKSFIRIC